MFCFALLFLNVATRKFLIARVNCIICLLNKAALNTIPLSNTRSTQNMIHRTKLHQCSPTSVWLPHVFFKNSNSNTSPKGKKKLDFISIKIFCSLKDRIKKATGKPQIWKKNICNSYTYLTKEYYHTVIYSGLLTNLCKS